MPRHSIIKLLKGKESKKKLFSWEMIVFPTKGTRTIGYPYAETNVDLTLYHTDNSEINSKWFTDLNV